MLIPTRTETAIMDPIGGVRSDRLKYLVPQISADIKADAGERSEESDECRTVRVTRPLTRVTGPSSRVKNKTRDAKRVGECCTDANLLAVQWSL